MDTFKVLGVCGPLPAASEEYLISLTCDPFKNTVLLAIKFEGEQLASIHYTKLRFSTQLSQVKQPKFNVTDSLSRGSHMIYAAYDFPKKVKRSVGPEALKKVRAFFKEYFWQCRSGDCSALFDGEYWTVRTNYGGTERKVTKCQFDDPQFYKPIEIILNLCGITEYRFERQRSHR